jgi:hypothetical protein
MKPVVPPADLAITAAVTVGAVVSGTLMAIVALATEPALPTA